MAHRGVHDPPYWRVAQLARWAVCTPDLWRGRLLLAGWSDPANAPLNVVLDVALAMQVDLAPAWWDRRKFIADLYEALDAPPAPLRDVWGDRVESEAGSGRLARPPAVARKARKAVSE